MNILVKKTIDMSEKEKNDICLLYREVFGKNKSLKNFIHEFENNEFGYSYYSLMYENDTLVGSYAVIPFKFIYLKKELVFGQAVNTMIKEEFRGNPFSLKKMAKAVYKEMKIDGISFVYGFPNDNIYLVRKKILKWKDIYNLDIYLLPTNLGKIKKKLKIFNFLNTFLISILNIFSSKKYSNNENYNIYKKDTEEFRKYRFTEEYKKVVLESNVYGYYKIEKFENIRTAFIVDINHLTTNNLELMVKLIYNLEKEIDLIAYFGKLKKTPINMYKIPEKIKPKNTYMAGIILNNNDVDESIFDIKNWRVTLSNFDWI